MNRMITIGSGVVAFAVTAVSTSCFLLHRENSQLWLPQAPTVRRSKFLARRV